MGKQIPDPGFAGDDGRATPEVEAALRRVATDRAAEPALVDALRASRLLVPVVALLGELAESSDGGPAGEKSADMAVLVLRAKGRAALPAFTALDRLAAWRDDARPVPIAGPRAAAAAYAEGADTLLIDPAGPYGHPLSGVALRALAEDRPLLAPERDPQVLDALRAAVEAEPLIARAHLAGAEAGGCTLTLVVEAGSEPAGVQDAARRVAERLAADEVLRSRLAGPLDLVLSAG